ncbi:MAG TPA: c-type cytochrome domain-containing protein [Oligoflexus sp.]|uniref:c-type cytochrome domain-containing protein n=1 Tax=Oligoflexus sp. TaxID=1971216 RepID=UPI002D45E91B|nr:c-type cytochrome domain-containing protein [Oligoflexus sp.]HYX35007.1 c-type cytochrome domain-containing protein [Oligoflexus sp.]
MRAATFQMITGLFMVTLAIGCNESEVTASYKNNRSFASSVQSSGDAAVGGGNLESASLAILQTNCVKCHGAGSAQGGFSIIDNVEAMISSNKYIIPGDPEGSAIYKRIAVAKNMPPAGPLSDADAATIKQWIAVLKLESDALAILQNNCATCHGAGASSGGFGIIDDVQAMIASNKYIIPGNPEGSAIYKRMAVARNMPPAGPLAGNDTDTIKAWIAGLK